MKTAESQVLTISTIDAFNKLLQESNRPVVVDFWAPWCGPCQLMAPVLEAFADENSEAFIVAKVNVDNFAALAARFEIRSIPSLLIFRDGQEIERLVGTVSKEELLTKAQKATA